VRKRRDNGKYSRMLKGMVALEADGQAAGLVEGPAEPWTVYILRCADGTFYTGIAKDVGKRVAQHNAGKGARYTRTRLPVVILYLEECPSRARALSREHAIKQLGREGKQRLVVRGGP
jgi:predicted GIY-YIG superfamily endonuclease